MIWVVLAFLAFCGVIAVSPGGGVKAALSSAWAIMGLCAIGAVLFAIGRALS
ncbi:hypothetical protein [Piscinibacter gummiphilus]|uniref:Uncharacterized protein n=1 Tax=Piscinibacter gummiphilus TaxID=946333 RepID=A0ABZ0CN83_9BURK|nr:hypothetical protein [Piscinibacter gummiphilus]WOB06451.1 hypothetical protein RXV79_16135 [Piscinibacter gummiphilus]